MSALLAAARVAAAAIRAVRKAAATKSAPPRLVPLGYRSSDLEVEALSMLLADDRMRCTLPGCGLCQLVTESAGWSA